MRLRYICFHVKLNFSINFGCRWVRYIQILHELVLKRMLKEGRRGKNKETRKGTNEFVISVQRNSMKIPVAVSRIQQDISQRDSARVWDEREKKGWKRARNQTRSSMEKAGVTEEGDRTHLKKTRICLRR